MDTDLSRQPETESDARKIRGGGYPDPDPDMELADVEAARLTRALYGDPQIKVTGGGRHLQLPEWSLTYRAGGRVYEVTGRQVAQIRNPVGLEDRDITWCQALDGRQLCHDDQVTILTPVAFHTGRGVITGLLPGGPGDVPCVQVRDTQGRLITVNAVNVVVDGVPPRQDMPAGTHTCTSTEPHGAHMTPASDGIGSRRCPGIGSARDRA